MKSTLQDRDGDLYVVVEDNNMDTPVTRTYWYPTGLRTHNVVTSYGEEIIGHEVERHRFGDGRYLLKLGVSSIGREIMVLLKHGGKTLASFVDDTPVPQPKVRKGTELRWYFGRWEKYSKKDGWIPA